MLIWLRKRQRQLAAILVAVFATGLLSMTCQNCLAGTDIHDVVTHDAPGKYCMHDEESVNANDTESTYDNCPTICDCEELSFISESAIRLAEFGTIDKYKSDNQDIPYYLSQTLLTAHIDVSDITRVRSDVPDRACYSPLERYCVLLN